jgi:hypothetical protein
MSEREPIRTPGIDPEAVAHVLGKPLERGPSGEPELVLEDSATGLSVRLTLHTERAAVSFYVRVGRGFGGFLHLSGIHDVELKTAQREVHFLAPFGERLCRFAVAAQGQFLAVVDGNAAGGQSGGDQKA